VKKETIMATIERKLIDMARNAKRSGIPLETLTHGAKPWAREILEKEYTRFKPRKPGSAFAQEMKKREAIGRWAQAKARDERAEMLGQDAPPKSYLDQVSELIDEQGFAEECKHGHANCSLKAGGHCSDEMSQDRQPEMKPIDAEVAELQEKLGKALETLRETEDELREMKGANFAARDAIKAARKEAEQKAIDSLLRYKFQMFGYWAAIWVHMNRIAKECGLGAEPSPFWALVQLAGKIDAGVESGRAGGDA
jgi:hypothetical protein